MSIHLSPRFNPSPIKQLLTVAVVGGLFWTTAGCSGGDGSAGNDAAGSPSVSGNTGQSGSFPGAGSGPAAAGTGARSGSDSGSGGSSAGQNSGSGGAVATGGTAGAGETAGAGGKPATDGSAGMGGKPGIGGTGGIAETAGAGGKPATGGAGGMAGAPSSGGGSGCGAGLTPTISVTTAAQLDAALTQAKSGDVISIAAGTYALSGKSYKLSASNVKIFGSAGETILDYQATASTDAKYGIDISGSSNTICGLTFARASDNGIHITGDSNTIDRCEFYGCFDSGLQISGPQAETPPHPAKNLIINCDSHDNYDTKASGGNADGFASKINIGPGNKFFGCVAHDNSDDGWDTFPKTASGTNPVTIENCVSYHNGYHNGVGSGNGNGFKVGSDQTGGSAHIIKNSVAFDNGSKGLDQNHNQGIATIQNCSSVNNDRNVAFKEYSGANITNTVADGGWEQVSGTDSGNVKSAATSTFMNLKPSSLTRAADGTLHLNGFCVYSPSNAGAHF